jgi:diguanylate cyclase (GGDEF)-like protein
MVCPVPRRCRNPALIGSSPALPLDVSSACALEPIHIPGAIQPHGALLAALADGLVVTHASANLAAILGLLPEAVLGRPLEMALGPMACRALTVTGLPDGTTFDPACGLAAPQGGSLHLQAHRSGRHICVDIEPVGIGAEHGPPISLSRSVLETFEHAAGPEDLCRRAVDGLRAITGYDRVMAYRFAEDGHGEVIAEARAASQEPYLGLRYPASDVPAQARRQYLRHRVGAIADSSYLPVPLIADPILDDGAPLDLSLSALRSVSPVHRNYMRNMNTCASLTVGLAHRRTLWGMLVCHHATPRVAGPELRAAAGIVGQVVSLLLGSLGEATAYAEQLERQTMLSALVERLAVAKPLPAALAAAGAELLGLMTASGAIAHISGTKLRFGRLPPSAAAERALSLLLAEAKGKVMAVNDLGLRYPPLHACKRQGSGALLLPLGLGDNDAILWFRPELPQTIAWGGDPTEHAISDPSTGTLSPRSSFAAWKETVRGRSTPWTEVDLVMAGKLSNALDAAVAQRTKQELARLRHYDPLTGLPNRGLLQERLTDANGGSRSGAALLFLDLDRFKSVNDTLDHAAGDALLVEVARRLVSITAPDKLTARLGGDEFVVLGFGLQSAALASLAERIREAIEAPFQIAGQLCHISVSIGIATAATSGDLDLVRAADMAMYAAKHDGGNRGVSFDHSLLDRAAQRFELEQDMRSALSAGDQFNLLYQPLFGVSNGTKWLAGFEALIRWRHPRHGWMSPGQFMPLAEQSGLILPLGDWVLSRALRQANVFRLLGREMLQMSVNVSPLQLQRPGFCSGLASAIEAEGLSPATLSLEVTETMQTDAASLTVLQDIRKIGVRVAIDDFGIGYSSLSYLRRLPADLVKLDRSFLDGNDDEDDSARFVEAVIALAHVAGKTVVFEGIETQAQFDLATAGGADIVQGFFLAPPLSANAAEDLVR